jgi:hypothetical protein
MPESSISFRSLGELPGRISDGKPPEARSLVQNSGAVLLMRRWYLSYNSQDLALMQGLEGALKRKDPDASIFLAPKSLRVGGFWLPELARQIAESTAFVLLVGERGLGPWQIIEYYEALDRRVKQHDFPVVLVLLDGRPAPGLPFLGARRSGSSSATYNAGWRSRRRCRQADWLFERPVGGPGDVVPVWPPIKLFWVPVVVLFLIRACTHKCARNVRIWGQADMPGQAE